MKPKNCFNTSDEINLARTNSFGLRRDEKPVNNLPVGAQKRGRKPKSASPFTKNFTTLLKDSGWTHRKAAKVAGLSPSVISGWTAGSVPNDLAALLKITDALKADFQFILTGISSHVVSPQRLEEIFECEEEVSGIFRVDFRRLRFRK